MKRLLGLLAGLIISSPIEALSQQGLIITITLEEQSDCIKGGGCVVVPRQVVLEGMNYAYQKGVETCPPPPVLSPAPRRFQL